MKIVAVCDRAVPVELMKNLRELEKYGAEVVLLEDQALYDNEAITELMIRYEKQGADACKANPELIEAAADADVIVVHLGVVNTEVIQNAKNLKIVAVLRSGTENIQQNLCEERGIRVINAPGRSGPAVADMAVGLMLAEMKDIARGHKYLMDGIWTKKFPNTEPLNIRDMRRCTVGIVGAGQIGRKVIKRLQGFECKIVVHDPFMTKEEVEAMGYTAVSMEELLEQSDIISLHLRLSEKTENFFGKQEFARMKKTAYFINTARAGLVDEEALIEALQNHRIQGAGLDVFQKEPLPADSPFLKLDNVTLTPHMAGSSADTFLNSVEIIKDELTSLFEKGEI